jgi:hypothetical protein
MNQQQIAAEELPLVLALHGFEMSQQQCIEAWLHSAVQTGLLNTNWICRADEVACDAWLVNATSSTVPHTDTSSPLDIPTWSLAWPPQEASDDQMHLAREAFMQAIEALEEQTQPYAIRYALGREIVLQHLRQENLRQAWQVMSDNRMVALVDFNELKVFLRPDAHCLEMQEVRWVRRSAASAPDDFIRLPLERVLWDYARRSAYEVLPATYWRRPLELRRYPRLPLAYMNEQEIALISSLRKQRLNCDELSVTLGYSSDQVGRMLSRLWLSGAVKTHKLGMLENWLDAIKRWSLSQPSKPLSMRLPDSAYPAPERASLFLDERTQLSYQ